MELKNFIDDQGSVKVWPRKQEAKNLVIAYLADFFKPGKDYKEKEVNAIISGHHTFGDFFLLRREMISRGHLKRTPNGSRYWKPSAD